MSFALLSAPRINISEQYDLSKLANLTLALSRLPDARNETRRTIRLSFDYKTSEIGPGDVFEVDEERYRLICHNLRRILVVPCMV